MEIPKDILLKIDELFPAIEDNITARNLMEEITQATANVGFAQLIRSILILSEGNLSKSGRSYSLIFMEIREM